MNEENSHIEEEMKDAPTLGRLKGKKSFQAPEGYFESLAAELASRIEDEAVLEEAPGLRSIDKKEAFQAPEGYFEANAARIKRAIAPEKQPSGRVVSFWQKPKTLLSIAAAIFAVVSMTWILTPKSDAEVQFSEEELVAAIEAEGIDAFELADALSPTDFTADFDLDLKDEDLDDLMDEIDISDLEQELIEGI